MMQRGDVGYRGGMNTAEAINRRQLLECISRMPLPARQELSLVATHIGDFWKYLVSRNEGNKACIFDVNLDIILKKDYRDAPIFVFRIHNVAKWDSSMEEKIKTSLPFVINHELNPASWIGTDRLRITETFRGADNPTGNPNMLLLFVPYSALLPTPKTASVARNLHDNETSSSPREDDLIRRQISPSKKATLFLLLLLLFLAGAVIILVLEPLVHSFCGFFWSWISHAFSITPTANPPTPTPTATSNNRI